MGGCCAPGGGMLVAARASQKYQHVASTRQGWGCRRRFGEPGREDARRPRSPSSARPPVFPLPRSFSKARLGLTL